MTLTETHAITGIGTKATATEAEPEATDTQLYGHTFDPRVFHRGMTDLQEFILTLNQSQHAHELPEDPPTPHDYNEENNTITPTEDTALKTVIDAIPNGWDATVVVDANENYNGHFGVVSVLRCGGGVNIWTKTLIRGHRIEEINIEFTDLTSDDRTDTQSIENINIPATPRMLAHYTRVLTKTITIGYTSVISTATRAFDYTMTEPTPSNNRPSHRIRQIEFNQNRWANARGTSRQTITNNLSQARDELSEWGVEDLHGDPIATQTQYRNQYPALKATDSKEDAYVILV